MIEDTVKKIFKKYQGQEDNLSTLVNEFFPVALGLRPASFPLFYEFNYRKRLTAELPNSSLDEELEIAKELGLKLIVYNQISKLGIDNLRYFLVKKENKKAITKMKYLQLDQSLCIKDIGKILEYPQCCIEAFANCMQNEIIADDYAQEQIIKYRQSGRDVNPFAYFVWGFIPCKPDCKPAVEKGQAIFKKFMQIDKEIATAYMEGLYEYSSRLELEGAEGTKVLIRHLLDTAQQN
jgi:hypothetical protein